MPRKNPRLLSRLLPATLCAILIAAAPAVAQQHPDETDIPIVARAPAATGYRLNVLLEGLEHPWALAFLPNGDMLITERPGRLRLVRNGRLIPSPVGGLPPVLALNQGGLMDVSLHPDFENNQLIYLTYSSGTRDANHTRLARARLDDNRLADLEVIFEVDPLKPGGQHFGSRIVWLPDGTMLVAIGDGGNPPVRADGTLTRDHGQRLDSHLAKVIRINDDGSVPDDNPFVGRDGAKPEVYSYGHRNIQGMVIDPESGRVWANEHGPRGGDELNLIRPGENYGWPIATFGNAFPDWRGNLFSGALMSTDIRRIILDGENIVREESIRIGQRVRDVRQGPDGMLYVLTDRRDGRLIRIEPE